ncbi:hypothetical protein L6452_36671 [Arctium lappa]|uniref:Uncharacterized protein n=1 Tax=Arctium lappa TaxID=4217 RepID=A0ACB8YA04_ARCLA|nr:hypothetical protein L6452_36671 [Arctium lappa]
MFKIKLQITYPTGKGTKANQKPSYLPAIHSLENAKFLPPKSTFSSILHDFIELKRRNLFTGVQFSRLDLWR